MSCSTPASAPSAPLAVAMVVAALVLSGCQASRPSAEPVAVPEPEAASVSGAAPATVYRIDPEASEVRVLVYRGGALARLGHNHVMVAPVHGEVRAGSSAAASSFRLQIEAAALQVDPPAARADEGDEFASAVDADSRAGTRANMLGERVLDAANHPTIGIESVALAGPQWNPDVTAQITLRGRIATATFPAAVVEHGDLLTIVARLSVPLSSFGIEPFTALGGALQVQDRLDVRVRLTAVR